MEHKAIRDIEEKAARVRRNTADPRILVDGITMAGGALGLVCAFALCGMVSDNFNPFILVPGLALAGAAAGYWVARCAYFLRDAAEKVRERMALRRKTRADPEDGAGGRARTAAFRRPNSV